MFSRNQSLWRTLNNGMGIHSRTRCPSHPAPSKAKCGVCEPRCRMGVTGGGEETDGRRVQPPSASGLSPRRGGEMRSARKEAAEDRTLRRNIGERRKDRRTPDQRTQHTPERAIELPLPSGVLANQESEALVAALRRGLDSREVQWRVPSSAASFLALRLCLIPCRETADPC